MTAAVIQTRALQRLDEDSSAPVYWTPAEILAAINEGQRFFVFLTLCLQKTVNLALTGGTVFYSMLSQSSFRDWLLPLHIRVSGGAKVEPARLDALDGRNPSWQAATGTPERYGHLGFDFIALDPHPSGSGTTLEFTYAHSPAVITTTTATPEIEEEDHPALIDWVRFRLRAKEGGQEFQKGMQYFERFMETAKKRAEYVRQRNLAGRYDNVPPELDHFDVSRLMALSKPANRPWIKK